MNHAKFFSFVLALAAACGRSGADYIVLDLPQDQPVVPAANVAAGLTTLARDWDFSQSQFANTLDWLDCDNSDDSKDWHAGIHGWNNTLIPPASCANDIFQTVDPATGQTVLDLRFRPEYGTNIIAMDTLNQNGHSTAAFPMGYYLETRARSEIGGTNDSGSAVWQGTVNSARSDGYPQTGFIEIDTFHHYGWGGGDANTFNYYVNPGNWNAYLWNTSDSTLNLPSVWSMDTYHTYGTLITSDGDSAIFTCSYVDGIFQSCADNNAVQAEYAMPMNIMVSTSNSAGTATQENHLYIQDIRVWSCPNWADQMTQDTTPVCTGSILSATPDYSGHSVSNEVYWHN